MEDISLKDRNGNPQAFSGVDKLMIPAKDSTGDTQVWVPYTYGEAVSKTVEPDFSGGDMAVPTADGELVKELTITKPEKLVPKNIAEGIEISGIVGALKVPESLANVPVELDFSGGNQTISAPDGYLLKSAIINKPSTLTPENIADGIEIAGVLGELTVPEGLEELPVELDFSGGNQMISAPEGYLVKSAIIQKPSTLVPENIANGVDIAGVVGALTVAEGLENIPVTLDFSNGNQTITAPDGALVKSAIIQKPETLIPENVASGVNIAGIVGTHDGGGGGSDELILEVGPFQTTITSESPVAGFETRINLPTGATIREVILSKSIDDASNVSGFLSYIEELTPSSLTKEERDGYDVYTYSGSMFGFFAKSVIVSMLVVKYKI